MNYKKLNKDFSFFIIENLLLDSKYNLFGLKLGQLNRQFTDKVPTLAVGKHEESFNVQLYINPTFWEGLDTKSRIFVIIHEIMHVLEECWTMRDILGAKTEEELNLLNVAADLSINTRIKSYLNLPIPEGGMDVNSDWLKPFNLKSCESTRYYYNKLKETLNKEKGEIGQNRQKQDEVDNGTTKKRLEESLEENSPINHKTWKELEELSDIEKDVLKQSINTQMRSVIEDCKNIGTIKHLVDLEKYKISVKKSEINWKNILRLFVSSSIISHTKPNKLRPNKRYSFLPGTKNVYKSKGVFLTDSSGSISDLELKTANNELHNMWRTKVTELDMACWDCGVGDLESYNGSLDFKRTKSGGTDCNITIKYINENASKHNWEYAVIFTDGYFPNITIKSKIPTLFLLTETGVNSALISLGYKHVKIKNI